MISVDSVTHLLQRGDEEHGQRDQMQHSEGYQQEDHGCSPLKEESDVLCVNRRPCNFIVTIRDRACNICFKTALWSEIKHCQHRPSVLDPPSVLSRKLCALSSRLSTSALTISARLPNHKYVKRSVFRARPVSEENIRASALCNHCEQ